VTGSATELQAAFRAGWLAAQLYGPLLERASGSAVGHLPSISELPRDQRVALSLLELSEALSLAAAGTGYYSALDVVTAVRRSGSWHARFRQAIAGLHQKLLVELTVRDARLGRAYSLGRSLSDTAWLPADIESFRQQLTPYRVAELDGWLSSLAPVLGHDPVTAVRGSLRTWSDWVAEPRIGRRKVSWPRDGQRIQLALRRQGWVWHDLLAGHRDARSLLTPDAYVQAADSAVRRIRGLARRIVIRFWGAVTCLLAVAGGLVYLALTYAAGAAKFWAVFLTAVSGAGALLQGVRGGVSGLGRRVEAPLWQLERDDALAVGATRLPPGASTGHLWRRVTRRRAAAEPAAASLGASQLRHGLPGAGQPGAGQRATGQPATAQPGAGGPGAAAGQGAAEPGVSQPSAGQAVGGQPPGGGPAISGPGSGQRGDRRDTPGGHVRVPAPAPPATGAAGTGPAPQAPVQPSQPVPDDDAGTDGH
jgi:hypothetical protein